MKPSLAIHEIAARRAVAVNGGPGVTYVVTVQDILEYLDAHADGATVSERERVAEPKRAAVAGEYTTVSIRELARRCEILLAEEQEKPLPDNALIGCLCDCVRMTREFERWPPGTPLIEETPAATQPATGDGTGEDELFTLANEICGSLGRAGYGPEHDAEMALILEQLRKARELGAREAQPHRIAVRVLRERDELKEKLAAAETQATEIRAALCKLADVETDTGETTLELVHLVELDVNCEHERAEKAEARVKAWTPVVLWACIEQATPAERALQIEHFAAQIPAEHRPEVKP